MLIQAVVFVDAPQPTGTDEGSCTDSDKTSEGDPELFPDRLTNAVYEGINSKWNESHSSGEYPAFFLAKLL